MSCITCAHRMKKIKNKYRPHSFLNGFSTIYFFIYFFMRQNSSRSKLTWNLKIGMPRHTVRQNKTASTYDVKNCLDPIKLYKIHEAIHYSPVICDMELINSQGDWLWVHTYGTNEMHA